MWSLICPPSSASSLARSGLFSAAVFSVCFYSGLIRDKALTCPTRHQAGSRSQTAGAIAICCVVGTCKSSTCSWHESKLDNCSSRVMGVLGILVHYWCIGEIIIYELNNIRQLISVCFLYMHLSVCTKCVIYTWYCFVKPSPPGDWECLACAHERLAVCAHARKPVSKGVRAPTQSKH